MSAVAPQVLDCPHFTAGRCRSCGWLGRAYDAQLAAKDATTHQVVAAALGDRPAPAWQPPVASAPEGFRNKAKMVVTGPVDAPRLGIIGPDGDGVDLRDCALHTPGLQRALPVLAGFVTRAALAPYDIATGRGELKHVLVTESPGGGLMVRWVLRSTEAESRIRKHLPWLLATLPAARVVTINVQPVHQAVLEGDREVVLTDDDTLPMLVNGLTLHLRPRSFFQTNTAIAAALYRTARMWVEEVRPASVWDLYCGVGGFAVHLAAPGRSVVGVEISADAVASAERSRDEAGLPGEVRFEVGDATAYVAAAESGSVPDLVVVNPPRRGLGDPLAESLERSAAPYVLYSSCNPATLAADLAVLRSYTPVRAQVFDMFPQTAHQEVLVLLAAGG